MEYKNKNYFVVSPFSLRKRKEWSIKNYLSLMEKIYLNTNMIPVVCGDKPFKITAPFIVNLCDKTTLLQFINTIQGAKLVIGNDSACIHIATSLNVPSVCIGCERYGRFMPYDFEESRKGMAVPRLVYREHIQDITVDEVWNVIKEMI